MKVDLTPAEFLVFAVCYSNYSPSEIDSLWFSEVDAKSRAEALGIGWSINPMRVNGASPYLALADAMEELSAARKTIRLVTWESIAGANRRNGEPPRL